MTLTASIPPSLSKNADLFSPLITFLCICICVLQKVWVCGLRVISSLLQDHEMSHCVALGTLPALLINIANPKVQKNVPFWNSANGKKMKRRNMYVYEYFNIYVSSERVRVCFGNYNTLWNGLSQCTAFDRCERTGCIRAGEKSF